MNHTGIYPVFQHPDEGGVGEIAAILPANIHFHKVSADPLCAIAFVDIFMEYQSDDFCGGFINNKVTDFFIPLVGSSFVFKAVSVGKGATGIQTAFGELFQPRFHTHGGFDALAGCLPVSDIIQQLVHMVVKALLSFHCAPYFNTVFDKPFYYKWRFIILTS